MKSYISLWQFCLKERRWGGPARAVASRILNFICKENYSGVRILKRDFDEVRRRFDENENVLFRWSVSSSYVEYICRKLMVKSEGLMGFLGIEGFDADVTYNPGRKRRKEWFFNTVKVFDGESEEKKIVFASFKTNSEAERNSSVDGRGRVFVRSNTGVRVFVDYRDNLIVDKDDPVIAVQGEKKYGRGIVKGLSKLGSENSEDSLTWNTFRTLEKIRPELWFPVLFPDIEMSRDEYENMKLYFWKEFWPPGERPVREGNSEVDLAIETRGKLIFVEAKYKSEISEYTKHDTERDQIIRNVDVGSCEAVKSGKDFYFVLLVPEGNVFSVERLRKYKENPEEIRRKIGSYRKDIENYSVISRRMSVLFWEDILGMVEDEGVQSKAGIELSGLLDYLRERF